MEAYDVAFDREAGDDLGKLRDHIAAAAGRDVADAFLDRMIAFCEGFSAAPHRGASHDDLRPGLRCVGWRRIVTVAFEVDDSARRVVILGVYYRGRDVLAALQARVQDKREG